jgi:glycine cleavage system H protein
MEIPEDLKYSREHEWALVEENVATVGITDFAQEQLGDIVFVELPAVGDKVAKDEPVGVIESVKAVSDIYAPVSGIVVEINDDLPESPEMINDDPYGDGWIVKIEFDDPTDLDDLLGSDAYEEYLADQQE